MTVGTSVFQALTGALSRGLSRTSGRALRRRSAALTLLAFGPMLGLLLSGCADMSDSMTVAFADPSKYDLWSCKQLETERKSLNTRAAELQGLMAKADTGTAGPVVAELAYRNEYLAVRGQSHYANEAWRSNKCHESPPDAATPPAGSPAPSANAKPSPRSKSGGAVY